MARCIHGFIGYTKEVFRVDTDITFVPGLHSNQSSIESLFSNIRNDGHDRTDIYGTGILIQNIRTFSLKNLKPLRSKVYPVSLISEERNFNDSKLALNLPAMFEAKRLHHYRYHWLLKKYLKKKHSSTVTKIMPPGEIVLDTVQGIVMYPKLNDLALENNHTFQEYMATDEFLWDIYWQ